MVINHYKSAVTRKIRKNKYPNNIFHWQSRFYEKIVRDDNELYRIINYIKNNPKKWDRDRNNRWDLWM